MTDIEICQRDMLYRSSTLLIWRHPAPAGTIKRTTAMTIELLYLTAQIHRWLNVRVARHLEAQAQRLAR